MKTQFVIVWSQLWPEYKLQQFFCQVPVSISANFRNDLRSSKQVVCSLFIRSTIQGDSTIYIFTLRISRMGCSHIGGDNYLYNIALRTRECWQKMCIFFTQIAFADTFLHCSGRYLQVLSCLATLKCAKKNCYTRPKTASDWRIYQKRNVKAFV